MSEKAQKVAQDFQVQAENAISPGDLKAAAEFYVQCVK